MAQNEDQPARVEGQGEGTPTGPLTPPPGYGSASPPPPPPSGNTVYVPPELRPSSSTQPVQPVQRPQPAPQMVASAKEPRRTPILGPILLIGVGVIFLLINIGVLSQDIWSQLVQLWPLLLIAFGLDLLIGRRNPVLSAVLILLLLGVGVGLVYANGGLWTGNAKSLSWDVNKGEATSANVDMNVGIAQLKVDSITAHNDKLLMSTLKYPENQPEPEHSSTVEGNTANIHISQRTSNNIGMFFGSKGMDWDVSLSPDVPTKVTLDSGTGSTDLDLEKLKVTDLRVNAGTGEVNVVFPSDAAKTIGEINGGVGSLNITIPEGVEAHIRVDTGLGGVDVDPRFEGKGDHVYESSGYSHEPKNKLDLEVHAGVGSVNIESK